MIISEQEKNRIRKLHKNYSIIKEQDDVKGKEETSSIQGISTSLLHPITQERLSGGRTMNVYEIMMMLAGCQEDKENSPYSILSPMGLSSSSNDNPMVSFENKKFLAGGRHNIR